MFPFRPRGAPTSVSRGTPMPNSVHRGPKGGSQLADLATPCSLRRTAARTRRVAASSARVGAHNEDGTEGSRVDVGYLPSKARLGSLAPAEQVSAQLPAPQITKHLWPPLAAWGKGRSPHQSNPLSVEVSGNNTDCLGTPISAQRCPTSWRFAMPANTCAPLEAWTVCLRRVRHQAPRRPLDRSRRLPGCEIPPLAGDHRRA